MTIPLYSLNNQRLRRSDVKAREEGILKYFVNLMVPFSHIETEEFQDMILGFDSDFKFMSRHTLRKRISSRYDTIRAKVTDELKKATAIATTADS